MTKHKVKVNSNVNAATSSSTTTNTTAAASYVAAYYDSDNEPPAETVMDRLLWRHDPVESKSDWTIEIIVKSNMQNGDDEDCVGNETILSSHTYHVHTQNLTAGPRRSEYFCQMLQDGGRFVESQTKTSRIQLQHVMVAEAFPVMLDFVYSSERDDPTPFTTDNATALYSLAKYFGIQRLQYVAKQFWKADMKKSIKACEKYREHATILQEEKILQEATRSCMHNIQQISTSSHLLHIDHIKFWLDLEQSHMDNPYHSCLQKENNKCKAVRIKNQIHLSRLMGQFFLNNHVAVGGPQVFLRLTSASFLPQIHVDAAIPLLDAAQIVLAVLKNSDGGLHERQSSELSNLQERCIQSIVSNWKELKLDDNNSPIVQLLYQQSPLILARLFSSTVTAAQVAASTNSDAIMIETLRKSNDYLRKCYLEGSHLKRKYDDDDDIGRQRILQNTFQSNKRACGM